MASLIQIALRCSRCSGLLRTTIPVHTDVLHPQPTTGSGLTPVSYLSTSPPTLPWIVNRYNSVRVNLTEAVAEGWKLKYLEDFPAMINTHLSQWRAQGRSAVWLHIPISHSVLIPLAAEKGFSLHHGSGKEIVMTCWLLDSKQNRLPPYASHQVGVCGIVYREDTEQILVTQDKHKPPVWKFPGGLSEHGEDIGDAAVREVKEETGIDSTFCSILAFRQQHRLLSYFNISDLYFICRMTPLSYDLHPCPDELVRCEWMRLEELVYSQEATPLTQRVSKLLLEGRQDGFNSVDIGMEEWPMTFPGWTQDKTYKLFLRTSSQE